MVNVSSVPHRKVCRPEAKKFGLVVRQLRESRGLTQEELAERAEVSATYVGFVERGDNVPTLTVIIQIASALNVRPSDLLRDF
ncbi:MAG TPA: helix-turn-helix transcriptional regulator [Gemmatimonadaceae bacterium]|nr:helix-turn-helix transcriptional regulator [Gemmatimonadaceae bacterium]